ncbi:hypothetical protein F8197_25750 [Duganella sp. FT27W]|nr:hypothetical protein [Duganella sp. FT27W]
MAATLKHATAPTKTPKKSVNPKRGAKASGKAAGPNQAVKVLGPKERVFKTKWFASAAASAGISDVELCQAIDELNKGQGDDLGGGVWKKRLNNNLHRSIVLAKLKKRWIYAFLFAKKDLENIDKKELKAFKKLAKSYGEMPEEKLDESVKVKELMEICHDC